MAPFLTAWPATRLLLPCFGLIEFLLAHQRADFLRHPVALGLELLDFGYALAPTLVEHMHFGDFCIIPCPACGQPFADKIRPFADQLHIKHGRIMQTTPLVARRE